MGMMKWLARRGNPGGTARWAAKGYRHLSQVNQEMAPGGPDLIRALIHARYAVMPNPEQEGFLRGIADDLKGLHGLVVAILTVEAGFAENSDSNQQTIMMVVAEELGKNGVPTNVIFGGRS